MDKRITVTILSIILIFTIIFAFKKKANDRPIASNIPVNLLPEAEPEPEPEPSEPEEPNIPPELYELLNQSPKEDEEEVPPPQDEEQPPKKQKPIEELPPAPKVEYAIFSKAYVKPNSEVFQIYQGRVCKTDNFYTIDRLMPCIVLTKVQHRDRIFYYVKMDDPSFAPDINLIEMFNLERPHEKK